MRYLLVLAAMVMLTGCAGAKERRAPNFSLKTPDGKVVSLSDYKDKIVVLNFWATWCPPCREELPEFAQFYEENKSKGIVLIGIEVGGNVKLTKEMIRDNGITYPVLMSDGRVESQYGGIRAIPTTFVIDRSGMVVPGTGIPGAMDKGTLEDLVKRAQTWK